MKPKLLSIIVPSYNEAIKIKNSIKKIKTYVEKLKLNVEIIVIDDGSTDDTKKILNKINGIIILKNQKNKGKGYSVKRGILKAKGDYALFLDADLSLPIENLGKFLKFIPEYDIVIASRKKHDSTLSKDQSDFRKLAGKIYSKFVKLMIISKFDDTQCGFKLFNIKKTKKLFVKQTIFRFSFDVEILYLANKSKLKIKELGIELKNNPDSSINIIKDSIIMIKDILKIKLNDLLKKYD